MPKINFLRLWEGEGEGEGGGEGLLQSNNLVCINM